LFYRVDLFVRQRWVEPRLEMPENIFEDGDDYVTLPSNFFDNLWHPDPYILNAKVSGMFFYSIQNYNNLGYFVIRVSNENNLEWNLISVSP
jgi:hypothetical protein